MKKANSQVVCNFLMEHIFVRFGVPQKIVLNNATNFSSEEISLFYYEHSVSLAHSSDYFPQGNGQAEFNNKNLVAIIKKLVSDNSQDWHKRLYEALWVDQITPKRAIGMVPFELVYGIGAQVSLPLELSAAKLQSIIEDQFFRDSLEKRVMYLHKLENARRKLVDHIIEHQMTMKRIFDRRAHPQNFLKNDEVLLWDKREEPKGAHGKLESLWKSPFFISEIVGPNTFHLKYPNGIILPFTYNGRYLKLVKF